MTKTANFIYSAAQLGHRELSMTQRYAHLSPDHMRAVADLTLRRQKCRVPSGYPRGGRLGSEPVTLRWITQILYFAVSL